MQINMQIKPCKNKPKYSNYANYSLNVCLFFSDLQLSCWC